MCLKLKHKRRCEGKGKVRPLADNRKGTCIWTCGKDTKKRQKKERFCFAGISWTVDGRGRRGGREDFSLSFGVHLLHISLRSAIESLRMYP